MNEPITQWHVQKYGEKMEQYDIDNSFFGCVTTKIYRLENVYYVELWHNGYCLAYHELITR